MVVDTEAERRFSLDNLSLGARNLLDTFPDRASLDDGVGICPWPMASPFGYNGRYVYGRVEVPFTR